jgi:hypothetical protein
MGTSGCTPALAKRYYLLPEHYPKESRKRIGDLFLVHINYMLIKEEKKGSMMHNRFQLEEKVQWKLASYMTAILKLRIYWLI